ncbi:MAG TPA: hypothetical protein PKJ08_02625 [Candidatus Cloacimonadota bacterium]|nr:hypothetical protein [Candidatus Cloacimonadota bacterium]HOD53400.1 hypothetical protein [Candidatus Cloacimonadota bacterium]HPM01487.1 hypothetical protein [Candidatus Cloacimonadota bacterium]
MRYNTGIFEVLERFFSLDFQRLILYFLILFILYIFIRFYTNRRKKLIALSKIQKMPANIWFYSKLIDFELGIDKVNSMRLLKCFYDYLQRKYKINDSDLKEKTIFQWVNEKEEDLEYIELYGDIYNRINELKQNDSSEVITYIKSIKKYFNQEDLTDWIEKRRQENCNNC